MRRRGFTLVELILVIAIIAILAGAMVPLISSSRKDAREAKVRADLDSVKTAAVMLHSDTSKWPPGGTAGDGLLIASGIVDWNGPYVDSWGRDPWNTTYAIFNSSGNNSQYAFSYGPNATNESLAGDDLYVLITSNRTK